MTTSKYKNREGQSRPNREEQERGWPKRFPIFCPRCYLRHCLCGTDWFRDRAIKEADRAARELDYSERRSW